MKGEIMRGSNCLKHDSLQSYLNSQHPFLSMHPSFHSVYATKIPTPPRATFTDEIDTYKMDQWITGTQKLFVGENSEVRLVGDIDVTQEAITFRFDEDLQFRIPLRPTVALTGKVVLARDPGTGLITSYKEFWDQDVNTVLKSAKFSFKM